MTEATPFLRKYDITFLCPPTIPGRTSLALRGILLLSLCVFAFSRRGFLLFGAYSSSVSGKSFLTAASADL